MESNCVLETNKQTKKSSAFIREMKSHGFLYAMFIPGMIFLIIFNYIPMTGVLLAFKNINFRDGLIKSPWVGFKNFEFFFKSPDALVIARNTIAYNLVFIILGLVLQITFAIILNELRNRFAAKIYQTIMFLPHFLSWVVIGMILYTFLSPTYGFVNKQLLEPLGIAPVNWYGEPKYWPFILVFLNVLKGTGYGTVVYLAAIAGIDQEIYEAAAIDGANKRQQIFNITIPALIPMMTILTIMALGRIFSADFGLFYNATLNQGLLKNATNVIDLYVYNTLIVTNNMGISSAAGLLQSIVGFTLIMTSNFIVKKINPDNAFI